LRPPAYQNAQTLIFFNRQTKEEKSLCELSKYYAVRSKKTLSVFISVDSIRCGELLLA
jgi:hypothetical protein